jgi:hypothetical protein
MGCDGGDGAQQPRASESSTTVGTRGAFPAVTSAAPLPECTVADVVFDVAGEGATGDTVVYVEADFGGTRDCHMDASATLRISEPNGTSVDVAGNPASGRLVGDISEGTNASFGFLWSGCAPGDHVDERHQVSIRAEVDRFGVFDGSGITPRCGDESGGSSFSPR